MSDSMVCHICNRVLDTDNIFKFNGESLCEDCYYSETVVCEHCGERIWEGDNAGSDSLYLCSHCFNDYYTTCEDCGRIIHRDYANYLDDYDDYAYCDVCYNQRSTGPIHAYDYKPTPIFYGDGPRYFGVELEIDDGGKDSDNASSLLDLINTDAEMIYIKSDGSLSDGLEIVSHPMSLDFHKCRMQWCDLMDEAIRLHYLSHKTSTCGLHIHVNRTSFGTTREEQDSVISRILYFVEQHWLELLKFSRRTEYQMNRWAARYGYKESPGDILDTAKGGSIGRYACVNITNWDTVEFRMFRGTLKYNTFIATLELVNKICDLAVSLTDSEIAKIAWTSFVNDLDEDADIELITYLKERRLYINDSVSVEEDV